jgi:hypothetical protein
MNDIGNAAHNGNKISLQSSLVFYGRIKAWFEQLPDVLSPKRIILPVQLNLQYAPARSA